MPDTVETRSLQFLVEERRKLVNQHTSQLQILIYWLKQIGQAVPATTDAALLNTADLCIRPAVQVLAAQRSGIAEFDSQIEAFYQTHPDRFLMASLPGAGPALEPRLIAALGTNRERFESASSMACCFGIAPVTVSSGNSRWVHWRWACSKFVRQTFHEWANCSIRSCGWAREHYDKQRAKGKGHHASIRSVAFKWIRILFRCWRDRVPYCEKRYLEAIGRRAGASAPVAGKVIPVSPAVQWESCGGFSKIVELSS
jgi:transposase